MSEKKTKALGYVRVEKRMRQWKRTGGIIGKSVREIIYDEMLLS